MLSMTKRTIPKIPFIPALIIALTLLGFACLCSGCMSPEQQDKMAKEAGPEVMNIRQFQGETARAESVTVIGKVKWRDILSVGDITEIQLPNGERHVWVVYSNGRCVPTTKFKQTHHDYCIGESR